MANTTSPLLPPTEELLKRFGERLRLARLRRRLQAKQVAERAGMTEVTLRRVERGMPGVTLGAYVAVMQTLQLQDEIEKWAEDDPLGRHLQDTPGHGGMRPRRVRHVLAGKAAPVTVTGGSASFQVQQAKTDTPQASAVTSAPENKPARHDSISSADLQKVIKRSPKSGDDKT